MRRFLLQENVSRLRGLLSHATSDIERQRVQRLLTEAEDELIAGSEIWKLTCPHLAIRSEFGCYAEDLLEKIAAAQGASFASLQIFDMERRALYLVAQINFNKTFVQEFATVRRGDGSVCDRAALTRESVQAVDVQNDRKYAVLKPFAQQNGIHAIQSTPILSPAGDLWGVYSTHFSQPAPFADGRLQAGGEILIQLRTVIGASMGY
jgi:hypothetical protein